MAGHAASPPPPPPGRPMNDETAAPARAARPVRAPALRAAAWMVGALASFTLMAIAGRQLSAELSTFQILFFRSAIGLLVIGSLVARAGGRQLRTPQFGIHLLRNVAHYAGQFGWFYGLALLPLTQVFAIEFTTPVWTLLLAALFLGERFTVPRVISVALGLLGMLLILRPGIVPFDLASLAVLLAAVCYGISYITTKQLVSTDSPLTILFWMTVIQLPLGLVAALPRWVTPSPALWPWLVVVGLTALTAHYSMSRALKLADATVVVPMDFLRLPLIALVGYLAYGERLDPLVLLGGAVMVAGNVYNVRAERARSAAAAAAVSAATSPASPGRG